jgi:hypothetical protein
MLLIFNLLYFNSKNRFKRLGGELRNHFFKLPDNKYEEIFTRTVGQLKDRQRLLAAQLDSWQNNHTRFRDALSNNYKILPYHQPMQLDPKPTQPTMIVGRD